MRRISFLIAMLILTSPLKSLANDTAFGGSGAAPIPIKQTNVAMQAEHIVITGHDIERADMRGNWEFTCDYIFKNMLDMPLSFQMGFPFPVNDALGETTTPAGHPISQKGSALVYDFAVTVDGNPIKTTKYKIAPIPNMDYQDAYIWPISMAAQQIVKIHHHYITGITVNSMGQYYVTFVLKTGGLWKGGTIGSSRLEVIPNTPTRMCIELDKTADYLTPKPAGVQVSGWSKDRKYSWDLKNFEPKDDLELCLITGKNYVRYFIVNPILQGTGYNNTNIDLNKMSASELKYLRNTIYAQYGKQFATPELQTYFDKQWWYERNPNYVDSMLNDDDKKVIARIVKLEGK